ncbi:hypothetical protein Ancab_014571 [Ancistrocladus abbreviatus]
MSDGAEERKRETEYNLLWEAGVGDYSRAVSRVAVSQICQSVGFECVKESALEALSDVAVKYIFDLGKLASSYANLAGRSECNVFDIAKGLEDLGSSTGFLGASQVDHCSMGLGFLNEVVEFVEKAEDIPFAHSIPQFPVTKFYRVIPSFLQMGETQSGNHIPAWLPAFPDHHTYIHSSMWNERKTDPQAEKVEQARQRRKAERSLLNLQQRLMSDDSAGPSGLANHSNVVQECSASHADGMNQSGALENNPFLAPPLLAGEKDVSSVGLPTKVTKKDDDKMQGSVLEAFAPAIDALKSGASDPMECDRKVPLDRRPVVPFRLKGGRKMVGEDLDVILRNRGRERNAQWFGRDEEKDDKKRRAELILRQSLEHPQDLTQM